LLISIPGIAELSARTLLAEIGTDMSRFPTAAHLVSWAGLCPKNDESAGKRRSTRMRKGAAWPKTTLIQSAWSAIKTKGSYLQALYHRLRARRGSKKASGAVAASMLTAIWHMLSNGTFYQDSRHRPSSASRQAHPGHAPRRQAHQPRLRCRNQASGRMTRGLFLSRM
jgi:hypothetical protein